VPLESRSVLSKEILIKRYGIVLEPYAQLIVDLFVAHHSRCAGVRKLLGGEEMEEISELSYNKAVGISTNNTSVTVIIQKNVFLDYNTLAAMRDEIKDFDRLCVNVEVDFKQMYTTYTLTNLIDLEYHRKAHYFYNTRPFYRSPKLQSVLEEHVALCTRNKKLHAITSKVIQCYIYHCSKVPRFTVYEENPDENTLVVYLSGIEQIDAHFVTQLHNLLRTSSICAWMPKCNAELRCEFNLATYADDSSDNPRPAKKRKPWLGLF